MAEYVCEKCREPIASEDVQICPECGFDAAAEHRTYAKRRARWGIFLSLTIVGLPLGLWLIYGSSKARKRADAATPATEV